jgi:hypothetical protein
MDFQFRREDFDAIDRAYREDLDRNDAEHIGLLAELCQIALEVLEDDDGASDYRFDVRHDRYKDGPEL